MENIPEVENIKSTEEELCEEHFMKTYKRDETGRFVVQMPLSKNPTCLGDSRVIALNRLNSVWRRLAKNQNILVLYRNFINEYLSMGHMEEVLDDSKPEIAFYLPHHPVIRLQSTSTPLRVVFNASAVTSSGESLNSLQLNGGVIQDDLFSILLRFRKHKYAIIADIKKMFRMISIDSNQRDLLRILWKDNIDSPIKTFRLKTVTYGTKSASYLAARVLKQLAIDDGKEFPIAASLLLRDMYMDDLLTGSDNIETGMELQKQLILLLKGAGMEWHKWSSNSPFLLPDSKNSDNKILSCPNETRTLGLLWKSQIDCFTFEVDVDTDVKPVTKKVVLSTIARIYDPLGLLGPVITKAKLIMQRLWQLKLNWSEPLPAKEVDEWNRFVTSLSCINDVSIPRYCMIDKSVRTELHTFCDASEKAFGAVVYIRSISISGNNSVALLCSKSRVAPLKTITIPRLELCAAVLASKLITKVQRALMTNIDEIFMWCDSSIVLAWINKPLHELKTFVKNRVSVIQALTNLQTWRHVKSKTNPADLISRGIDPEKIQCSDLWWTGPLFLHSAQDLSPSTCTSVDCDELYLKEIKNTPNDAMCASLQTQEELDVIKNCSSFFKLQRVIAWCLRFAKNTRQRTDPLTGTLKSSELSEALVIIVKNVQAECFADEIRRLRAGKPLPNSSKFLNLCPFVDDQGILRVGGRLRHSNLSNESKHPILLPKSHHVTNLIIDYYHRKALHAGASVVLSLIRQRFWFISGRNIVRRHLHKCLICFKSKNQETTQLMGDLPRDRVTRSRPFQKVGIDFAGPIITKPNLPRSKIQIKSYIALFICLATKAVHLEAVSEISTAAFLATLRRFISRRGLPSDIFSDNATNFKGANNYLKNQIKLIKSDAIQNFIAENSIQWHFIPPFAPHHGGLWESNIKSAKAHLTKTCKAAILNFEELNTLLAQIEACLNSRPITPISSNPCEIEALTPGHFLIGAPLLALPETEAIEALSLKSRFELIQRLRNSFWSRWSRDYLTNLQTRSKWTNTKENLKVGDLVVLKDNDRPPPSCWSLARITKVHFGDDGLVRVVDLKTQRGSCKRSITKVCKIPMQ